LFQTTSIPSRKNLSLGENFVFIQTEKFSRIRNNYISRLFWEQWRLYRFAKKYKFDIYYSPYQSLPIGIKSISKSIVTIHDAIPWLFAFQRQNFAYKLYSEISKRSCRRANKFISISESSKIDIVSVYKIKPELIEVIYEFANIKFSEEPTEEIRKSVHEKFNISKPFILFTGGLKKHKNLRILLKSFATLIEKYGADVELVIGGSVKRSTSTASVLHYDVESLRGYAKTKNISERVKFVGSLSEDELNVFYHDAVVLVSLSLYEGFGLPILESMMAETPVIASNISAHEEVANGAAILVNPFGYNEVAEKMAFFINNEKERNLYVEKGLERVKNFNREDITSRLLDIFSELYKDDNIFIINK
jgi:glycosyltransferase involved in cell wall biosynthesis